MPVLSKQNLRKPHILCYLPETRTSSCQGFSLQALFQPSFEGKRLGVLLKRGIAVGMLEQTKMGEGRDYDNFQATTRSLPHTHMTRHHEMITGGVEL